MKSSIHIPDDLINRIRQYNHNHRDQPINVSAVCRIALEKKLNEVE